jgi:broad specificity phosphatase PhoE
MRILIVRHGLSTNDVVMHDIGAMDVSVTEANRLWMDRRVDDPELTERGKEEAEEFGAYYSRILAESGPAIKIYCSPFWRALQTALPLAKAVSGVHVVDNQIFMRSVACTQMERMEKRLGRGSS